MKRFAIITIMFLFVAASAFAGSYEDGVKAIENKDYKTAFGIFSKLAEKGDPDAQHNVGVMYLNGFGVQQDYKQAANWYQKAAEQGHRSAQLIIGNMYLSGKGVLQNNKQAENWYRKAAEQGYVDAQHNLGNMYANGFGVPKDYKQAAIWYQKAAEQGYADAQNSIGVLYENGLGIPKDYKQAAIWYRKAAEQGDADAQSNLGNMYLNGFGVQQDYKQAVIWYQKAAEQGHISAQFNIGLAYVKGQGVPQDYTLAYMWWNLAAAGGNEIAVNNRNILAKKMTPAQIEKAQEMSKNWKSYTDILIQETTALNGSKYIDNGNGTITDNPSQLMWQKGENSLLYNWYRATGTYDEKFNSSSQNVCGSLRLAGYTDWRLPSITELKSLVDKGFYPTINTTYFPNAYARDYISSTVGGFSGVDARYVDFASGETGYVLKGSISGDYVRCVR